MSNSLRDYDRIEDRLRQHRQVESTPIVIVEGPDDVLVLKNHLPSEIIFAADGKSNVLRAMNSLASWNIVGVRAIVDADFDEPDDERGDPRIVLYEGRDLEAMLVILGVLAHLFEHQGSAAKLNALGGAAQLCADLVQEAHAVAELRLANVRQSWGLRFNSVDLSAKTDRKTLQIDLARFVAALIQASDTHATAAFVLDAVRNDALDGRGPRGKDVLSLAGLALRHRAGSLPAAATGVETLGAQLRSSAGLAFERSHWLELARASIAAAEAELISVAA